MSDPDLRPSAALQSSGTQAALGAIGVQPTGTSAAAFAEIQRADSQFWLRAATAAGLVQ
jgi:hypothetical protein